MTHSTLNSLVSTESKLKLFNLEKIIYFLEMIRDVRKKQECNNVICEKHIAHTENIKLQNELISKLLNEIG